MKIIRRVYVALSQNMFFLCKHLIFFRKGHFYQAMPADLRWEGSPFPPNRVKTTPKSILCFIFGNPLVSHLVNQLCSFWSCSCLPNGKLAHLKYFPIREKNLSTVSPIGIELQTRRPLVKTFQGVFPVVVKYENHKKCICRPIAKHLKYILLREKPFLLFLKRGEI